MMLTMHIESTKKIELLVTSMLVGLKFPTIYLCVCLSVNQINLSFNLSIHSIYLSFFFCALHADKSATAHSRLVLY